MQANNHTGKLDVLCEGNSTTGGCGKEWRDAAFAKHIGVSVNRYYKRLLFLHDSMYYKMIYFSYTVAGFTVITAFTFDQCWRKCFSISQKQELDSTFFPSFSHTCLSSPSTLWHWSRTWSRVQQYSRLQTPCTPRLSYRYTEETFTCALYIFVH